MDNSDVIRILGLDPGQSAGASIVDILPDGSIKLLFSETIYTDKLLRRYPELELELGSSGAKLQLLRLRLAKLLEMYKPDYMATEIPFLKLKRATAFKSLTECVLTFQQTLFDSPHTDNALIRIEASVVKTAMGVDGRSGEKEDMLKALHRYPDISFGNYDIDILDNNAIDSICVCIAAKKVLF